MNAEHSRFQRVEAYGAAVAKPGANGFVPLVRVVNGSGSYMFLNLIQAVHTNPTTTILDRVLAGFTWRVNLFSTNGNAEKEVSIDADNLSSVPGCRWTFTDGTPAIRNLLVAPAKRIEWGIDVTAFGSIPAAITFFAGAIVGVQFAADSLQEAELVALVNKP